MTTAPQSNRARRHCDRGCNFTEKLKFQEVSWSTARGGESRYPGWGVTDPLARALQQFVNGNVTIMYTCHKLYLEREHLPK